jgi:hypothetical protein
MIVAKQPVAVEKGTNARCKDAIAHWILFVLSQSNSRFSTACSSQTPIPLTLFNTSSQNNLRSFHTLIVVGRRTCPKDLLANGLLHPFNNASNALGTQSDVRQARYFLGAHSLAEVEPKN